MPLCVCSSKANFYIIYMCLHATFTIYTYLYVFCKQIHVFFKIPLFLNFSKKKRNIFKTMVLLRQLSSHSLEIKYLRHLLFSKNTTWMSLRNRRPTGLQTLLVCLELSWGKYSVLSTHCLGLCQLT